MKKKKKISEKLVSFCKQLSHDYRFHWYDHCQRIYHDMLIIIITVR